MVWPHGQGGLNQCGHFVETRGERELIIRDFVKTPFMDGPKCDNTIRPSWILNSIYVER